MRNMPWRGEALTRSAGRWTTSSPTAPPPASPSWGSRHNEADRLTDFLQEVQERAKYHYWLFGHYHDNRAIDEKHILLWEQIVRVI